MRVIRRLDELGVPVESVVTIGNFDGVHIAHQTLLRSVVEEARRRGVTAAAVTFDPHPIRLLAPERAPQLLTPLARKTRLIAESGIELLAVLAFTREFSQRSPEEFVAQVLCGGLHALSVHVGPNFRFGHRQGGDVRYLRELAGRVGFELHVLSAVRLRGEPVSSSRIREILSQGEVHRAARLLGRPFAVSGGVVAGSGIGRNQAVPTLNLAPLAGQLPAKGVYVTRTQISGGWWESVTNVGTKPTFGEHRVTVESFLLDFAGEIAADEMEVEFLFRLRAERKFANAAALKAQILRDARRARKYFRLRQLLQAAPAPGQARPVRA